MIRQSLEYRHTSHVAPRGAHRWAQVCSHGLRRGLEHFAPDGAVAPAGQCCGRNTNAKHTHRAPVNARPPGKEYSYNGPSCLFCHVAPDGAYRWGGALSHGLRRGLNHTAPNRATAPRCQCTDRNTNNKSKRRSPGDARLRNAERPHSLRRISSHIAPTPACSRDKASSHGLRRPPNHATSHGAARTERVRCAIQVPSPTTPYHARTNTASHIESPPRRAAYSSPGRKPWEHAPNLNHISPGGAT